MNLIKSHKAWRRIRLVLANSLNQIIVLLFSPLFSLLVIRTASLELWGAFVQVLIVVNLGAHIAGWGNKEYLLREFSRNPAGLRAAWQAAFVTRLPLLVGLLLVLGLLYPAGYRPFLLLWATGLFLAQSFDVLVVYRRDFLVAALVEFLTLLFLIVSIVFQRSDLNITFLIGIYGFIQGLKGGFYAFYYRRDTLSGRLLPRITQHFAPRYWMIALPFFLLTFTGMLNSRIDLYVVSFYLPPIEVAEYQVFINFILYLQMAAGIILLPFVKGLYRLDYAVFFKLAGRLFLLGLIIVPLAMPVVYLVLQRLYGIELPLSYFLWGILYVLPLYFFAPIIYALFKAEKQTLVIGVNLIAVTLNLALDMILVPRMGSEGAILAAALVNCLVMIIYAVMLRRLMKAPGGSINYAPTLSGTPGPPGIG